MSSPSDGISPERPDFALERQQPETEPPPRDGPEVPESHRPSSDERALEDVVERDHPLS